jgi:putative mycofactocin binding protein MftB
VSISPPPGVAGPGFAAEAPWELHPQVSIRPERFGALLYHFGTRRLSFLKSPVLLAVVRELSSAPSARSAYATAGVADSDTARYDAALSALAASSMIRERTGG